MIAVKKLTVTVKRLKEDQNYFVQYIKEFLAILRRFWIISEDSRRLPN